MTPKSESEQAAKSDSPAGTATKVDKKISTTRDVLSAAAAGVTVIGALSTLAIWLASNYLVGEVNVVADRSYKDVEVTVYDMKGHESVFHSPRFELAPGKYHLAISCDGSPRQQADVRVKLAKTTDVRVTVGEVAQATVDSSRQKKWWQFWKHSAQKSESQDQ